MARTPYVRARKWNGGEATLQELGTAADENFKKLERVFVNPFDLFGVVDGSSAESGVIGEYVFSYIAPGAAVAAAATNTFGNITTISLTAGDWDVTGIAVAAGAPVASNQTLGAVSLFSGNTTTDHQDGDNVIHAAPANGNVAAMCVIPNWRVLITATTTVYLKLRTNYSASAPTLYGRISARRVR